MKAFINYINNKLKKYLIIQKYKRFNKLNFPNKGKFNKCVLIEFNAFNESHICQSLFANYLSKKYSLSIIGYFNYSILSSPLKRGLLRKLKWFFGSIINYKNHGIYKSFGTKKIIVPEITEDIKRKAVKKVKKIFKNIKSKKDILNIKVDNILIGDLIFDTYIKRNKISQFNFKDEKFNIMVEEFIILFYFWKNYFKYNIVHSIIGVHSVYSYAIPLRIAIFNNIKAYTINSRQISKLNSNYLFSGTNFMEYRKKFSELDPKIKRKGISDAKKVILRRLSGKGGIKNHLISNISSFHSKILPKEIIRDEKTNILICTRNVFDAVHVYGNLLFEDNYEWLNFLGKMSEKTNYNWYLKTHRNFEGKFTLYQPRSTELINEIIKKYKQIKILPNDYSHKQIINDGIDFVLTQHGSVGFEYAYNNVQVINASINNPQIAYSFNHNPKNKKEYEYLLRNLRKKKKLDIKKKDIYEFYFMRNLYQNKNWLFNNFKMIKNIGGWDKMMSHEIYEYAVNKISKKKIYKLNKYFSNFETSDYQVNTIEDLI